MQLDLKIIVQYFFICFFILDFRLEHKVPTQHLHQPSNTYFGEPQPDTHKLWFIPHHNSNTVTLHKPRTQEEIRNSRKYILYIF